MVRNKLCKKYSAYFEAAARKYFNFYDQTAVDLLYNQNYRFSNKFHYHTTSIISPFNIMQRSSQIILEEEK
jgi:hypothetical protein